MYQKAIAKIKRSIFPLFFRQIKDDNTSIGVSGTGFFINEYGYFITANHVIREAPDGAEILYAGNVPHNVLQPVQVEEVFSDPKNDIYIGYVENKLPAVSLLYDRTAIGTSVCLCGYPMAQIKQNPDGTINVLNVRQYWQPTYAIDEANVNDSGKQYRGFITQDTSLRGMSGGPVFDLNGNVHGIDVATVTRNIPLQNGENMPVHNGVVLGLHSIQDVIENYR